MGIFSKPDEDEWLWAVLLDLAGQGDVDAVGKVLEAHSEILEEIERESGDVEFTDKETMWKKFVGMIEK